MKNYEVGDFINDMVVIGMYNNPKSSHLMLRVKCMKCGNVKDVYAFTLEKSLGGMVHGAYCDRKSLEERYPIGTQINDFVVIGYNKSETNRGLIMKCLVCGKEKVVQPVNMNKSGSTITSHSQCSRSAYANYNGLSTVHPRLFSIWHNMNERIYNENFQSYARYGAMGLTCDYNNFEDFLNDLGASYYEHVAIYGEKDTSLDRINNSIGYVKGNLRWATKAEQVQNRECMKRNWFCAYSPNGKDVIADNNKTAFSNKYGLNASSVCKCIRNGTGTVDGWGFYDCKSPWLLPIDAVK